VVEGGIRKNPAFCLPYVRTAAMVSSCRISPTRVVIHRYGCGMLGRHGVFDGDIKSLPPTKYIPISHPPTTYPQFPFCQKGSKPKNPQKKKVKILLYRKKYILYLLIYKLQPLMIYGRRRNYTPRMGRQRLVPTRYF
jgi:hypothetical protein